MQHDCKHDQKEQIVVTMTKIVTNDNLVLNLLVIKDKISANVKHVEKTFGGMFSDLLVQIIVSQNLEHILLGSVIYNIIFKSTSFPHAICF